MKRLFVYGTLGPGRPNEHILGAIGGSWERATVTGALRQEGWGADLGYPGLDLDAGGSEIEGFLFSSVNLTQHWGTLDAFEGAGYERVLTTVKVDDQREVEAYVYVLRSP